MAYTKPYTIDATAGGDTVKAAITDKVDKNADQIVSDLNTHAALTTGAHSLLSAAQVSTGAFEAVGAVSTHAALTTGAHSLLSAALVSTGYFDTAGLAAAALSSSAALVSTHAALSTSAHSLASAAFVTTGAFEATGAVSTHAALTTGVHSLASAALVSSAYFVQATRAKFMATWTTSVLNVTGDGTVYSMVGAGLWTEVFDVSSNFSNGTFTAPATGQYLFTGTIQLAGISTSNALAIYLNTTQRNQIVLYCNPTYYGATGGNFVYNFAAIADMTATDTATLSLTGSNEGKTHDVIGGGNGTTFFCGMQI